MKDFKKVVQLGEVKLHGVVTAPLFCKIEYKAGRLSISGVEGPKANGDCKGSCGQIVMHEWDFVSHTYCAGWDADVVAKFRDVWNEYHLNDMTPNCEHQVGPEWTSREVAIYHYTLKQDVYGKQKAITSEAASALAFGSVVCYTVDELKVVNLKYKFTKESPELTEEEALHYEPSKKLFPSDKGPVEYKKTGWLKETEHSAGFLSKACPVCGYKYGSAWLKREVPEEVLEFLQGLPDSPTTPAWV